MELDAHTNPNRDHGLYPCIVGIIWLMFIELLLNAYVPKVLGAAIQVRSFFFVSGSCEIM